VNWSSNSRGASVRVLGNDSDGLRAFFRIPGEGARILVTDALIKPAYHAAGLTDQYNEALGAIKHCKNLRNQYAHCHWLDWPEEGLFFCDMDRAVKKAMGPLELRFLHVDAPLLEKQEEYFSYAFDWLWFLSNEYRERKGERSIRPHEAPKIIPQPSEHNPPEEHPVPLLPKDGG